MFIGSQSQYEQVSREIIDGLINTGYIEQIHAENDYHGIPKELYAIIVDHKGRVFMLSIKHTTTEGPVATATVINNAENSYSEQYRCGEYMFASEVMKNLMENRGTSEDISVHIHNYVNGFCVFETHHQYPCPSEFSVMGTHKFGYAVYMLTNDYSNTFMNISFEKYIRNTIHVQNMRDSVVEDKGTVEGLLNGKALHIMLYGTGTTYALVVSAYTKFLYFVCADYLGDGTSSVYARCIDPRSNSYGCEYNKIVDDNLIPNLDSWADGKIGGPCGISVSIKTCTGDAYCVEIDQGDEYITYNVLLSIDELGRVHDDFERVLDDAHFSDYIFACTRREKENKEKEEQEQKETKEKQAATKWLTSSDMEKLDSALKNYSHISWNAYFMAIAKLAAKRSKDPKTKVGAVIITPDDHRVVSVGYNGFPYGCDDSEFPWKKGDDLKYSETKYAYVVHAELNAILSARGRDLTGCHIYVTSSPCNECTKAIIQSGIKRIVYLEDYNPGSEGWIASAKMCRAAGVEMELYKKDGVDINLGEL